MPFGLKNSSQTFQCLMDMVFQNVYCVVNESIIVIKDDLINKIGNAQKTAERALHIAKETKELTEGLKEKFNKVQYHCENLKAENLRLKNMFITWIIIAEIVI